MTKQTDYGMVLMSRVAGDPGRLYNARELAGELKLPLPIVTKVLKLLARGSLLVAQRGVKGGYRLSRPPELISLAEIITALEGTPSITECTGEKSSDCDRESFCPMRTKWRGINEVVHQVLSGITLAEMAMPPSARLVTVSRRRPKLELEPETGSPLHT